MSTSHFKGAAHSFKTWMQAAKDDIAAGKQKPARRTQDAPPKVLTRRLLKLTKRA